MEFHGEIQKGELVLSPIQSKLREQWLASIKDGTRVKEVLTKEGITKTPKQVRAMFGVAVEMVRQRLDDMGVDVCGVSPNKDMVYDILKKACFGVGDNGEVLGLSQMTIPQASKAYQNCQRWTAVELQFDLPDPDPDWRRKVEQNA